jgi:hypothetical protein
MVELEYRAPLFSFTTGSLGPPPQRYKGVVALAVALSVPLLLIVILLLVG